LVQTSLDRAAVDQSFDNHADDFKMDCVLSVQPDAPSHPGRFPERGASALRCFWMYDKNLADRLMHDPFPFPAFRRNGMIPRSYIGSDSVCSYQRGGPFQNLEDLGRRPL
jgi:hypothetical protein